MTTAMIITTVLSTLSSFFLAGYIWFTEYRLHKLRNQVIDQAKKLYSADRDIKTLHFNQKVLHSQIKELRKDLKVYGEIKRSKDKRLFKETDEDDWPEINGLV